MLDLILITLCSLLSGLRGQAALQAENIALRHQVTVLQRTHTKRPVLKPGDRCLWVWLSRLWSGWRSALIIVMPETVFVCPDSFSTLIQDPCTPRARIENQRLTWNGPSNRNFSFACPEKLKPMGFSGCTTR